MITGNTFSEKKTFLENIKSIDLDNKKPEPHNNLGNLYLALNKHQKAIVSFKNAVTIDAKFFISHYNLGVAYKNIGRFEEAKKHLKEAVRINAQFYTAHRILSQITKYTINDEHFIFLKKSYDDPKIDNRQKTEIAFTLGKASEDIKDFNKAFQYYSDGNFFRRTVIDFSIENEKDEVSNIKKIFNKNLFNKFEQSGNLDFTPIFILGMPRSGTTLVEQILSSHPKVFGGDELNFLPDLIKKHFDNKTEKLFLENIITIDRSNLKNIAKAFKNKSFNVKELNKMDDNETINYITKLKGLGVWSSQMLMIFNLNRPDVFPIKDIGLLRAISKNYKKSYPPSKKFLDKISKLHAGYRSVFTWYMWRSIDPTDVEY